MSIQHLEEYRGNSDGPTIPRHTFVKPVAKFLHRRQVTALLAKHRSSSLSAELLDLLTVYLEFAIETPWLIIFNGRLSGPRRFHLLQRY
jgi:hypothetical protein